MCSERQASEAIDWKDRGMGRIAAAFSEIDDDEEDEIFETEVGRNSLLQSLRILIPTVDFPAFENGVSAAQLGALSGHLRGLTRLFDSILANVERNCDKAVEGARSLSDKKEAIVEQVSPESQQGVSEYIDGVILGGEAAEGFAEVFRDIVGIKPRLEEAIGECLQAALDQGEPETGQFLTAFTKAFGATTVDSEGNVVSGNLKTAPIYTWIFCLLPVLRSTVSSVPELHRMLVRLVGDEKVLSSDESSLEWDKDRRTVEGVCKQLNLSFRKRGRPKKKNPNQK